MFYCLGENTVQIQNYKNTKDEDQVPSLRHILQIEHLCHTESLLGWNLAVIIRNSWDGSKEWVALVFL